MSIVPAELVYSLITNERYDMAEVLGNYKHSFLKISFGGDIFGDQDEWTCSINVGKNDEDFNFGSDWNPEDLAYEHAMDIKSWFTDIKSGISVNANLRWVKLAIIGIDGKYTGAPVIHDLAEPAYGAYYQQAVVPQSSVALSMTTDVRRGPGKDGRIYPPLTGSVISNGREGNVIDKLDSFEKLISTINREYLSLLGPNYRVIVAAREGKTGPAINAEVTGVRVGDVIDTQRKRRNKMQENYTSKKLTVDLVLD